jgi:hypothetical protein
MNGDIQHVKPCPICRRKYCKRDGDSTYSYLLGKVNFKDGRCMYLTEPGDIFRYIGKKHMTVKNDKVLMNGLWFQKLSAIFKILHSLRDADTYKNPIEFWCSKNGDYIDLKTTPTENDLNYDEAFNDYIEKIENLNVLYEAIYEGRPEKLVLV